MSQKQEVEAKAMITKADYKKLCDFFSAEKKYKQINYYISNEDLLLKAQFYGLRIRSKKGKCELTLKVKNETGNLEINQDIKRIALFNLKYFDILPKGEVLDYLTNNNVCRTKHFYIIGKMITQRIDITYLTSLISIDKSKYNMTCDYEVECEDTLPLIAENNLKTFFSQHNIKYEKNELSKIARATNTK